LSEDIFYNHYNFENLVQKLDEIKKYFLELVFLKAITNEEIIIGSVKSYKEKDNAYIFRLSVKPDCQNKGTENRSWNQSKMFLNMLKDLSYLQVTKVIKICTYIKNPDTKSSNERI
jgi:hypothetical protein